LALALALGKHQTIVELLVAHMSFLTLQLLDLSSPAAAKLARLVLMSVSLFSPLQLGTPQLKEEEEEEEDFALIKWQHPSWETPD
jgi:hypothetical protein